MSAVYSISPDVAWVEAADGGKEEPSVWISHLQSGTQYELTDTAWLMWVLLAEQPRTAVELLEALRTEGGDQVEIRESEVESFLGRLHTQCLLVNP